MKDALSDKQLFESVSLKLGTVISDHHLRIPLTTEYGDKEINDSFSCRVW